MEKGHAVTVGSAGWEDKCHKAWVSARASGDYTSVKIFGFATDARGIPLVQKEGDPLPGEAFVSTTTVEVAAAPRGLSAGMWMQSRFRTSSCHSKCDVATVFKTPQLRRRGAPRQAG